MIGTVFQSYMSYRSLDRGIQANILQVRLVECSKILNSLQNFSSQDASYRLMLALRENRVPENIRLRSLANRPTDEAVEARKKERAEAGHKIAHDLTASLFLFDRQGRASLRLVERA